MPSPLTAGHGCLFYHLAFLFSFPSPRLFLLLKPTRWWWQSPRAPLTPLWLAQLDRPEKKEENFLFFLSLFEPWFFNGWLAFRLPFTRLFVVLWWFYLGGARIERRLRDLSGSTDKNNSRTPTHIYQHHQQGRPDWRRGRLVRRSLDPQSLSITRESRDSTYWLGRLIHHRPMERMDAIHLHLLFNWERFFFFRKKENETQSV